MTEDPFNELDENDDRPAVNPLTKFLKDNKSWLIATFVGSALVSVLAYSVVYKPTNENFNNTQSMFADCVPVNGRCP